MRLDRVFHKPGRYLLDGRLSKEGAAPDPDDPLGGDIGRAQTVIEAVEEKAATQPRPARNQRPAAERS